MIGLGSDKKTEQPARNAVDTSCLCNILQYLCKKKNKAKQKHKKGIGKSTYLIMFSIRYTAVKNNLQHFIAISPPVQKVNIGPPVQKVNENSSSSS